MNTIANLFATKDKRVQFEAEISIDRLTDVPLVHGRLFVRWKIRNAINDFRGSTQSCTLRDHSVAWDNRFTIKVNMVIGKDNVLIPCNLYLSVKKETQGGRKSESLGKITLDLAEFAGSKLNSRQYLLQQSKMNSSLNITVNMKQISGDPLFRAPETELSGIQNILGDQKAGKQDGTLSFNFDGTQSYIPGLDQYSNDAALIDDIFDKIREREQKLMIDAGKDPMAPAE